MNYGIVIFPPRDVQDLANSFRKRYDPRYSLIPPHITLKYPFQLKERKLEDVVSHLEKVAERTEPFQIEFHKVSTFHPTTNVVYLAIRNEEPVIRLHEQCNEGVLYDEETYSYVPHLTIAQEMTNAELNDIYGTLRMKDINITAEIDRFHLLYQMENEMWTVYQTFLFNKKK